MVVFNATPRSEVQLVAWLIDGHRREQFPALHFAANEAIEALCPGASQLVGLCATDVPGQTRLLVFDRIEMMDCST